MKNRALFALLLTFFSMLTQLTLAGNRIFIVKDSLKFCVREYDHGTNVSVMAVAVHCRSGCSALRLRWVKLAPKSPILF